MQMPNYGLLEYTDNTAPYWMFVSSYDTHEEAVAAIVERAGRELGEATIKLTLNNELYRFEAELQFAIIDYQSMHDQIQGMVR